MATLFGVESPQYIAPSGGALVTKTQGGVFGLFPGTPEYVRPELVPVTSTPPAGTAMVIAEPAEIEIKVRIPGVVSVQGSLTMQPAMVSVLVPALVAFARDVVGKGDGTMPSQGEPQRAASPQPSDPARERSETEQRPWDRD